MCPCPWKLLHFPKTSKFSASLSWGLKRWENLFNYYFEQFVYDLHHCAAIEQTIWEPQVCEVSIVKLNKSNILIQFSYYLSLLFINKVLQFLFLFLILFIYYLCKRWQALNVSRRVRNATGCWDMLRMSIVIRLLLLDVVVIVNIAVAVIMVGSIGLVRTRAWALFCFKCKICF